MATEETSHQNGGLGPATVEKPVVCFLGPISSYTHQATLESFPEDKYQLKPVVTIRDIFDETQSGAANYGVVPFENSSNGSVVFTLDNFADRSGTYADLHVCGEIYLDVHHCLLGHAQPEAAPLSAATNGSGATTASRDGADSSPLISGQCTPTPAQPAPEPARARPLTSLAHVKRIYSHPQAFGQCVRFLNQYLKGIETVDVSSTSRAAEMVAADPTHSSAAISSAVAAGLQGIDVLARNIEDRDDNTTRFFVLRKGRPDAKGGWTPVPVDKLLLPAVPTAEGELRRSKSLVSFTVTHKAPGALADVLECLREGGLNLTSINSRPSLEEPFQYVFFIEFEGHRYGDPEGRVEGVLRNVEKKAQKCRWLGSWENMRY